MLRTRDVFEVEKFYTDTRAYMRRHNIVDSDVAKAADFSVDTLRSAFRENRLTLVIACRLADIMDFRLDDYMKREF